MQKQEKDFQHITEPSSTIMIRKENDHYSIKEVNPLNGKVSFETETSWLKIDGFGVAASKIELSEHKKRIGITNNNNIILDV